MIFNAGDKEAKCANARVSRETRFPRVRSRLTPVRFSTLLHLKKSGNFENLETSIISTLHGRSQVVFNRVLYLVQYKWARLCTAIWSAVVEAQWNIFGSLFSRALQKRKRKKNI